MSLNNKYIFGLIYFCFIHLITSEYFFCIKKEDMEEYVPCKVSILGDAIVGKTCISDRYCKNTFSENYIATIGVDFFTKKININENIIKLQIWDIKGQEKWHSLLNVYIRGAKIIILVYDITNKESFEYISDLLKSIGENKCIFALVGNKIDLADKRQVTYEEGKKFADDNYMLFFEVSAKTGQGINDMFENIVKEYTQSKDINENNNDKLNPTNKKANQTNQIIIPHKKKNKKGKYGKDKSCLSKICCCC